MTGLWIGMALVSIGALALLLPVFRGRGADVPGADAARLTVFRTRLAELEADRAAGTIDAEQYAEARREIENSAAVELDGVGSTHPSGRRGVWVAVTALALVPVIAFTLYQRIGTGEVARAVSQPSAAPDFTVLVERLAAKMVENPDDLRGWMLLGRSRTSIGDFAGAVEAWRQALRLAPEDATVLANLTEAILLSDPSALTGEAATYIEAALLADPDHPKALWYGGLLADERGDAELAALRWNDLLAQDPPPELRRVIEDRLGIKGFVLRVEVSVSEDRVAELAPGAVLFVSVHDPEAPAGPPLAAVRTAAGDLPATVEITEAAAMLPGVTLAGRRVLRVVARISDEGAVERRPGDLIGEAVWTEGTDRSVTVDINRILR